LVALVRPTWEPAAKEVMRTIRKKVIIDESSRPIAVQIDYQDWLEIEQSLNLPSQRTPAMALARHAGSIALGEEPLAYQKRVRGEWA
jgi:hypothetical protein